MAKKIPTEVYSRIVGYFRPVQTWHKGKAAEFEDRKTLILKKEDLAGTKIRGCS